MSRRQRHLTLRPLPGAALQLDSRALSESVGGTVQTWLDRSGNSRNPTQTGGTSLQPVVAAGSAGQKVLQFDGVDDRLEIPSSTTFFKGFHDGSSSLLFAAARPAAPAAPSPDAGYALCGTGRTESASVGFALLWENRSIISATNAFRVDVGNGQGSGGGGAHSQLISSNQWSGGVWSVIRLATDAYAFPVADRIIGRVSGGAEIKGNTRSFTPTSGNSTYNMQIGAPGGALVVPFNGQIGAVLAFPNHSLSAAMQRRIDHALAAAFKISCA
jgi:hypothetical protein